MAYFFSGFSCWLFSANSFFQILYKRRPFNLIEKTTNAF
ncbi:hypothetical protein NIASO_02135 [Niabella soli DSM 19437]|uniref:Uncharacterized protein n=1 Tax=Niabella soli DSM 19437 TaxID=929713 RepID=W0F6X1_9BACT|nr:hypothetical protein NIASO_02135 [Niabella soli DSM 19437]